MLTLITILIVITCFLLAIIVLVQNPKGGGLATGFTGVNQFGGVKRTTDFLEKSTWTLIIVLFALSILSASVSSTNIVTDGTGTDSQMENLIEEEPVGQGLPTQQNNAPALEDNTQGGE